MTSWPGYPPPTPSRPPAPWYRNVWVWIGVYGVVAVGAALALLVLFFANVDEWDGAYYEDGYYEEGYYVEQESVNSAVAEPCDDMTRAGQNIEIFSTPAEGADALHQFVIAGRAIPDAIDTVAEADDSALQWRDDWITLLDAVDSYADDLTDNPEAEFEPPSTGGSPLMYEMSWVSDVPCELPPAIMALDAEVGGHY